MKRLLILMAMLFAITAVYAQELHQIQQNDITKFLGIPIDGTKAEIIQKLKAKGYTPTDIDSEVLEGEFNGKDVSIFIATNNNKVYRIMVIYNIPPSETDIKIEFNNLCHQFENNPRYTNLYDDQTIPEDENISYEMNVKNKRYQAIYYQHPKTDSIALYNQAKQELLSKYTQEQLDNPTEDISTDIRLTYLSLCSKQLAEFIYIYNKPVWFMIVERFGIYYIAIFYDNVYNQAKGEDL